MKRRHIAIFVFVLMCLSLFPVSPLAYGYWETDKVVNYGTMEVLTAPTLIAGVNAKELAINGSFELLENDNDLYRWVYTKSNNMPLPMDRRTTADAHSGMYALQFGSGETIVETVGVSRLDSDLQKRVEMSLWIKSPTDTFNFTFKNVAGYRDPDDKRGDYEHLDFRYQEAKSKAGFTVVPNQWCQMILKYDMPKYTCELTVSLSGCSQDVLIDDVSVLIEGVPEQEEGITKKPMAEGASELVKNGNFNDGKTSWSYEPGDPFEQNFAIGTEEGPQGSFAMLPKDNGPIYNKNGYEVTSAPYLAQRFASAEGEEYQISCKVKVASAKASSIGVGFRWTKGGNRIGRDNTKNGTFYQDGEWHEIVLRAICPEGANGFTLTIQRNGGGYFLLDDVSVYKTENPKNADVEVDEYFYYTEWPEGFVDVRDRTGLLGEATVSVKIQDGDRVIHPANGTPWTGTLADGKLTYAFPTSALAEVGKQYKVYVTVVSEDGTISESYEHPVYRFNRPTYLSANGTLIKPDRNGELQETDVVFAYGAKNTLIDDIALGGPTVALLVSGNAQGQGNLGTIERLDLCEENGMKAMLLVGAGSMTVPMDPVARDKILAAKDHPATFGYKVYDEAMQAGFTDEELMNAYVNIRKLDPNHPVYLDDSGEAYYERMGEFCDIMELDPYPTTGQDRGRSMGEKIALGVAAVKGRKPVSLLKQAYYWGNTFPTADESRHYTYQTVFSGGSAFGYFTFDDPGENEYINVKQASWPGIVEFAKWEQDFVFDAFVKGKYPVLNGQKTDDIWWRSFVNDGKIYAVAINRNSSTNQTTPETSPVTIDFKSFTGEYAAESYKVTRLAGGFDVTFADPENPDPNPETFVVTKPAGVETNLTVNGSTYTVNLPRQAAYVYEITPQQTVDFSGLMTTKYRDLEGFEAQRSAILKLENAGIVNDRTAYLYAPADKITRGEFAYFLANALELTAESLTSYSDVPSYQPYASAVAACKDSGLFTGLFADTFAPDTAISGQDAITLVIRAVKWYDRLKVGQTANTNYVYSGTAPETLTRADAAMIISHLYDWNEAFGPDTEFMQQVNSLSAEDINVFCEMIAGIGSAPRVDVWKTVKDNSNVSYMLIANNGSTAYTETIPKSFTYAYELSSQEESNVMETAQGFTLTVNPGDMLYLKITNTLKTGFYVGNVAKQFIPETGAYFRSVHTDEQEGFAVVYKKDAENGSWTMMNLYTDGDLVIPVEGKNRIKAFLWEHPITPVADVLVIEQDN